MSILPFRICQFPHFVVYVSEALVSTRNFRVTRTVNGTLNTEDVPKDVVRFLTQATFGPTEDAIQRLIADDADYEAWDPNA